MIVRHRADRPPELVARQTAHWDPVIDWARTALDAPYEVTVGITHHPQPDAALNAYGTALTELNAFELAAAHTVMTLTWPSSR